MKKQILAFTLFSSSALLTSCAVTQTTYSPGYNNDYVYSVGYYGYRPYWGSNFYTGSGWRNNYWGNRGFYNRGWGGWGWGNRGWGGRGWGGWGHRW